MVGRRLQVSNPQKKTGRRSENVTSWTHHTSTLQLCCVSIVVCPFFSVNSTHHLSMLSATYTVVFWIATTILTIPPTMGLRHFKPTQHVLAKSENCRHVAFRFICWQTGWVWCQSTSYSASGRSLIVTTEYWVPAAKSNVMQMMLKLNFPRYNSLFYGNKYSEMQAKVILPWRPEYNHVFE